MKKLLSLSLIFIGTLASYCQDIIIKTDKTEIKSKVLEIEETNVKYKLFDYQDGPTYNIQKKEVFMIIYKNGQRETFETPPITPVSSSQSAAPANNPPEDKTANQQTESDNTAEGQTESNLTDEAVNYNPIKLLFYFNSINVPDYGSTSGGVSGYVIEATYEAPIVKNYVNMGLFWNFSGYSSDFEGEGGGDGYGTGVGLYASGYLAINRLAGKLNKQNQGLFPFIRTGVGYFYGSHTYTTIASFFPSGEPYYQDITTESHTFGFDYKIGLDVLFSRKFGITILTDFKSIGGGVVFN